MIFDLGLVEYKEAYDFQTDLVRRRISGEIEDAAIIAEHPDVFTIGRAGKERNFIGKKTLLKEREIPFLCVDRGGDITFHGPGQIVLYPVIDLRARKKDLRLYLRDLEEVAINFLRTYGILGERSSAGTGVWAGGGKIAFIGVGTKSWITYHGLSVNVSVDLGFFSMIHPCGLAGLKVTSVSSILGKAQSVRTAKERLLEEFDGIFTNRDGYAGSRNAAVVA